MYDLAVRNYNLIAGRDPLATPYYLFLVRFDANPDQWVVEEPERLILSASAYWWTLSGMVSNNDFSVRVRIPLSQRLEVASLGGILPSASDRLAP